MPSTAPSSAKARPAPSRRGGKVAVEGWAETSELDAVELARRFEGAGAAAIVHTDVERDGAMGGPNLEATADLARGISIPVIVSGGVSSLADLLAIKAARDSGIVGAILGAGVAAGGLEIAAWGTLGAIAWLDANRSRLDRIADLRRTGLSFEPRVPRAQHQKYDRHTNE